MRKTQILINKHVFFRLMCEFWYDYVESKYVEKAKQCYIDTGSFIVCIKKDDIYKDIAEDV